MLPRDRPTRILMTADAVGGVWTYAVELCRELDRRGIEVVLAVMGPSPTQQQQEEIASLRSVTLHARPFRLEWMADPWEDVDAAGQWLLDLEWQLTPDVVHLNNYCHGALPWRAPVLIVGHSCVLSWWREVLREPVPPEWSAYATQVRHGLRHAAAVVAPSRGMASWLNEFYGPLPTTRVIANGRTPWPSRERKEPLVLTAGRLWDEAKNVAAVCEVAPALAWPVAVAGALSQTATTADTDTVQRDAICYLGRLSGDELGRWMARASIYVLPARYEPFGLSVLEAAGAGCALVLGDIPTLREIWGEDAVYVDPDDRAALRQALTTFIEDERLRVRFGTAARRRASRLTPDRMADAYCELYGELTRERRALLSLGAL